MIVDLEVAGPRALGEELGFQMGESVQLTPAQHRRLLARLEAGGLSVTNATPGGTVANTLNDYTHLSGEPAVLLGAIQSTIRPGDPADRDARAPRGHGLGPGRRRGARNLSRFEHKAADGRVNGSPPPTRDGSQSLGAAALRR